MSNRLSTWGTLILVVAFWLTLGQAAPLGHADTILPQCDPKNQHGGLDISPTYSVDRTLFQRVRVDDQFVLRKSTDGGLSWAEVVYPGGTEVAHLYFSPHYAQDQTLYAAYDGPLGRLDRSTDGGHSWTTLAAPRTSAITYPVMAVYDENTVFLGYGQGQPGGYSEQGLFYSADGGLTWEHRFVGGVAAVALSPNYAQDATILISPVAYHFDGGVSKSTDRGLTWQPSREGLRWGEDGATDQIAFSPDFAHDRTVFCANLWGFYKSTDAGEHWANNNAPQQPKFFSDPSFTVSPRYPQDQTLWLYWRRPEFGQARSTDGGATWGSLSAEVMPFAAREVCRAEGDCRVILFGQGRHGPFLKSFDGGDTWQCLESPDAPPTPTPPPAEIPEPATGWLLASGLAGVGGYLWQRTARRR